MLFIPVFSFVHFHECNYMMVSIYKKNSPHNNRDYINRKRTRASILWNTKLRNYTNDTMQRKL